MVFRGIHGRVGWRSTPDNVRSEEESMNPLYVVYGVVALAAVGAGGYGVWSYNHAITRAEKAEADAQYWKTEFDVETTVRKQREREYATSQRLVAEAKKRAKGLEDGKRDLENRLRAALVAPGPVGSVLNTALPDDLRRMRREAAGCETDLHVPCTGELGRGNISAADERRDGLPNHYGGDGTTKRTASSELR